MNTELSYVQWQISFIKCRFDTKNATFYGIHQYFLEMFVRSGLLRQCYFCPFHVLCHDITMKTTQYSNTTFYIYMFQIAFNAVWQLSIKSSFTVCSECKANFRGGWIANGKTQLDVKSGWAAWPDTSAQVQNVSPWMKNLCLPQVFVNLLH